MNDELLEFARQSLKQSVPCLPERSQELFRLMYGRKAGKRSVADAKIMSISDVVDEMNAQQLDWAMMQVKNTPNATPDTKG